jgi:ATP-dependent exoDNAse (exonuclease V) alpha subunit
MKISDYLSGNVLTQGQQELLVELECFLQTKTHSTFLFKGYAGVGKSFLMTGVTKYLKEQGREFVIIAPTGKAAKVIAGKTKQKASTIHRVIYSFFDTNKEPAGEDIHQELKQNYSMIRDNEDADDCVYIVDESSMVSDKFSQSELCKFGSGFLLQDLLEYIDIDNHPERKVLFIGDNAQLPPVRNAYSPALHEGVLKDIYQLQCQSFELTEVVRQKEGSGVMKNATNLRESLMSKDWQGFQFDTDNDDVELLTNDSFLNEYFYACGGAVEGSDDAVIIAYSNRQVNDYNHDIRAKIFSRGADIQVGEKIICVENYPTKYNFISNGEFGRITKILSDIECRSVEVREKTTKGTRSTMVELNFLDVEVEFLDDYGQPFTLTKKILLNLLDAPTPRISCLEYKALNTDFNKRFSSIYKREGTGYKEARRDDPYFNFLRIKFGYAITAHKSQGSEFPHVFVDTYRCGQSMEQYFRWLYTAITRTSDKLYIKQ